MRGTGTTWVAGVTSSSAVPVWRRSFAPINPLVLARRRHREPVFSTSFLRPRRRSVDAVDLVRRNCPPDVQPRSNRGSMRSHGNGSVSAEKERPLRAVLLVVIGDG